MFILTPYHKLKQRSSTNNKTMEEPSNNTLHEILIRIEKKVEKTNGRVSDLEKWKNRIAGGLVVISGVLIPIAIKVFF